MNWFLQRTRRGVNQQSDGKANGKDMMVDANNKYCSGLEGRKMVQKWLTQLAGHTERLDAHEIDGDLSPSDSADYLRVSPQPTYPEVLRRALERAGLDQSSLSDIDDGFSHDEINVREGRADTISLCSESIQALLRFLIAAEAATLEAAEDEHQYCCHDEQNFYLGANNIDDDDDDDDDDKLEVSSTPPDSFIDEKKASPIESPSTLAALSQQSSTNGIKSALSSANKSTNKKKKRTPNRVRFARADMSSLDFSREDNEQILDRILRHLTGVLVAAEGIRRCGFSRGQAQLLRDALRADEILLSSEQKSRAASFLAKEMEILCNLTTVHHHVSPSESLCSQILTRHTEILSSVLRKEMKRQLNETLIIATNTGNIRYNFDDPAALLHRALEILHDHGGPGWATTMEQNPELNDIEHAHDLLNVSSAHEYVLNVVTHTAVRKRVADGRLDRLQGLAQLVRQVASPNDVLNDYLLLPMYDFQKTQTPQEEDDDIPQAKRRKFGSEKLLEEKQIITPVFGKKSVSLTPTSIASLGALYDLEKLRQVLEESQDIVREFAQIAVTYINYDRQQRKNAKRKRTKLPKSAAASVSVFIFPALCDEDEDDFLQDPGI